MAVFAYQALDLDAAEINGTLVADTPRAARDQLRAKGLTIQRIGLLQAAHHGAGWIESRLVWMRRVSSAKSVSFVRELSTLLGVGIPLLEAIDTIGKQYSRRNAFRGSLLMLRDRVSEGLSLAEAMRQQPLIFDELAVQITEVGESSGNLDTVLEQLAEFKERSLQFKNRVAAAMIYPLIVLLTGMGVSLFLMTFVVPNLLSALLESGRPLPWATQVVKGISDLVLYRWWLILLVLAAVALSIGAVLRDPRGRLMWHRLQLKIPIVGDLIRKQAMVRIAVVVATLMRSGIVFDRAIHIAQRSTRNQVIRGALARCETAVQAGTDIAEALESTGAFPGVVVQIFSVGQQAGRLEEMLDRLAIDYDRQVTAASQRLTAVLEPVLILALAVVVGFIAFATVMPILEAGNVL